MPLCTGPAGRQPALPSSHIHKVGLTHTHTHTHTNTHARTHTFFAFSPPSAGFLELLKSFSLDTPTEEYGPLLVAVVTWKQAVPLLKLIAGWLKDGILATTDPALTDCVNDNCNDNVSTANLKKRLPEKGRRGGAGGGKGVAKPRAVESSTLHHCKVALLYIKWMLVRLLCSFLTLPNTLHSCTYLLP